MLRLEPSGLWHACVPSLPPSQQCSTTADIPRLVKNVLSNYKQRVSSKCECVTLLNETYFAAHASSMMSREVLGSLLEAHKVLTTIQSSLIPSLRAQQA